MKIIFVLLSYILSSTDLNSNQDIVASNITDSSTISSRIIFTGDTIIKDAIDISFEFTGEPNTNITSTIPDKIELLNSNDDKIVVGIYCDQKPDSFDGDGVATFHVLSQEFDIDTYQPSGSYHSSVLISVDY